MYLKTRTRVPENKPLHDEVAPVSHILRVSTLQYFLSLLITSHHTIVCLRNQGIAVAVPSGLTPPYRRRYDLRHTSRTRQGLDRGASQSEASPLARGQRSWTFGPEAPGVRPWRGSQAHHHAGVPRGPRGLTVAARPWVPSRVPHAALRGSPAERNAASASRRGSLLVTSSTPAAQRRLAAAGRTSPPNGPWRACRSLVRAKIQYIRSTPRRRWSALIIYTYTCIVRDVCLIRGAVKSTPSLPSLPRSVFITLRLSGTMSG